MSSRCRGQVGEVPIDVWMCPRPLHLILAVAVALSMLQTPIHARSAVASITPALPRTHVDTTYVPPSGRTVVVSGGGNVQAALNAAQAGDVITLEAGATFTGPFTLPNKPGSGWITIRTSAPDTSLPPRGTRVTPSYARNMPTLAAGSGSVITTAPGAHHYRFIAIEIRPREGAFLHNLVELGGGERSVDQLPHHIIFDRCYIHGDPIVGSRRGIALNSASTAVIDSYFSGFKKTDQDTQAIAGWNGTGPFKIVDNYLEAAGENVMFGGADPSIPNLVPSDIEVRGNYFSKPLSWMIGHPTYAGTPWSIKNIFELKNAARVLVDGNVFEHSWAGGQNGFALMFTPRNQNGSAPWSVVADVTFTHNIVQHATAGVNFLGADDNSPSRQLQRVLIQNNLFVDIGAFPTGSNTPGWWLQVHDGGTGATVGTADVVLDHNTVVQTGIPLYAQNRAGSAAPNTGFVFTNNIVANDHGVSGDNTGTPLLTLSTYFPGAVFVDNVLVGGSASSYPSSNFFPANFAAVGFVNFAGADYHLAGSSRYKHARIGGKDIGADIDALSAARASNLRR